MAKQSPGYVVGIDEVGRGALAGPVAVAAACLPANLKLITKNLKPELGELRDSKKLTPKQRETWFAYFKNHPKIEYAVARVYPRGIERLNISRSANLAAERAFLRLRAAKEAKTRSATENKQHPYIPEYVRMLLRRNIRRAAVFLDGGLYVGKKGKYPRTRTVVRGDEKIQAIKIASIIAKVHRDQLMRRLAKKYPQYGFEIHKGYGTKKHMAAIKKHGPSKAHRLTFLVTYPKIRLRV